MTTHRIENLADGIFSIAMTLLVLFVAMIPFSTSLIGNYPDEMVAKLFFDANLFILGIFSSLNWLYATSGYRLVDRSLDPRRIAIGKMRGAIIPFIVLLAMGLSVITPQWSSWVYILIPVILAYLRFRYKLN